MFNKFKSQVLSLIKTSEFKMYLFFVSVIVVFLGGYVVVGFPKAIRYLFVFFIALVLLFMVIYIALMQIPLYYVDDNKGTKNFMYKKEVHAKGFQRLFISLLFLVTMVGGIYILANGLKVETKEKVVVTKEIPKGYVLMTEDTLTSLVSKSDVYTFKVASNNEVTKYKGISKKYSAEEGENVTKQETILVTKTTKNFLGRVVEEEKEVVDVLR